MSLDFIGDIHGHVDELEALLKTLGYREKRGVYSHPSRQVFFTGDFIDRGPKIRETLWIIRRMVEEGKALAIMGNHEYNAICYNTKNPSQDDFLRPHRKKKNRDQHQKTIHEFTCHLDEYLDFIEWFKSLPLFYETDSFRAIHACWIQKHIDSIRTMVFGNEEMIDRHGRLKRPFFYQAADPTDRLYTVVEVSLKGLEMALPSGAVIKDQEGVERDQVRVRWWLDPARHSFAELSMAFREDVQTHLVDPHQFSTADHYCPHQKPIFFGHYWLTGVPQCFRDNVCCLDFSVARGGKLIAYRYDGESQLSNNRFVTV